MLGKTRTGLTFWSALVAAGLVGCGGHSSSKKSATGSTSGAATTTSSSTGTTNSNSTGGGITPGGGGIGGLPGGGGGIGGGLPGGGGGGIGGLPGGGLPGGGLPGGGGTPGGGGGGNPGGQPDDHGNNAQSATAMAANTGVAGVINYAGDADWFKVTLNAGVDYSFVVGNLAAGMDSVVRLLDATGNVIGENDDVNPTDPSSRFDAPTTAAAGDYYVVVVHKDPQATGSYEVRYTLTAALPPPPRPDDHGDDYMNATQATIGTPIAGEISMAGDVDFFKVDLVAGTTYEFQTQNLVAGVISGQMDTWLYLFDSNGTTLIEDNDDSAVPGAQQYSSRVPAAAAQGFTPTVSGTYYLAVEHYDLTAEDGGYDLLVQQFAAAPPPPPPPPDDHGNDYQNATTIAVGAMTGGRLETLQDVDYFKVDLVQGQQYEFKTQNLTPGGLTFGTSVDTILTLYDPTGTAQIARNDDHPLQPGVARTDRSSRIPTPYNAFYTAPADGTYYLEVESFGNAGLGTYEVIVIQQGATPPPPPPVDDHGNDAATATALTLGQPMNGNLEVGADVDYFQVDLAAGTNYELKTITQGDTMLRLYDAQGAVLGENDDEATGVKSSKLTYMPSAAATYYLAVTSPITTATTYQIQAAPVAAPPANPATLVSAMLDDVDGSGDASMGDTIKLTFSEDVSMITIQPVPPPVIDPANELDLLVAGNSFGAGATLTMGPAATEATITLGQDPILRLTGAFNPAALTIHSPSGVALKATTAISTASNGMAATGSADLDSTLQAGFRPAASLNGARGMAGAVVLDDGRVLVVNGLGDGQLLRNSSEIYDAGQWTYVHDLSGAAQGRMVAQNPATNQVYATARFAHTVTKLASGKVLVCGGTGFERQDAQGAAIIEELVSAYLFDPANNTFAYAGDVLNVARSGHYATLLPNGQVLIAGGYNGNAYNGQGGTLPTAELYDETTGTFTMLSQNGVDMTLPREGGSADLVGNKVLFVGGMLYAATQANPTVALYMAPGSEGYEPATNGFAADGAMGADRRWHASTKLASGELVIAGGDSGQAMLKSLEKYDPAAGAFSAMGDLNTARARAKSVVVNGDVLVVGGISIDRPAGQPAVVTEVATGELYNVQFNVSESYQLTNGRNSHEVVSVSSGKALVIGGFMGSTTAYGLSGTAVAQCEFFQVP